MPNKAIKTKKGTVNKKGGYNVVKYEADCDEKTLKMLMFASYESNGNPKDTDSGPFFAEPVIPDTMGEILLESSCNKFKN